MWIYKPCQRFLYFCHFTWIMDTVGNTVVAFICLNYCITILCCCGEFGVKYNRKFDSCFTWKNFHVDSFTVQSEREKEKSAILTEGGSIRPEFEQSNMLWTKRSPEGCAWQPSSRSQDKLKSLAPSLWFLIIKIQAVARWHFDLVKDQWDFWPFLNLR